MLSDEYRKDFELINNTYYMRMQLNTLEGGGSSAIAFEAKLKDGDLQAMSNAVVMEVNFLAAQLFELFMMINELVIVKSKRVFKYLAD